MIVEQRIHDLSQFGALHEWLLWGPAVGRGPRVVAVDLEAFEHGGVEQLAGFVGGGVVGLAGPAQQRQDDLEPVLEFGALDVGFGDQPAGVGDVGSQLSLALFEVLDR
ncbi:hypothetical protein FZI85_11110 [Mycobacterium sp. CBMA293]|uniref:hypothetical protein n=1 Tax=unclassified Mycolicibacterium TaxID=2636767 RepID=UPI0012DE9CF5|nr:MULTISPECIES: hypothetical protein [unclassified Mycolicibacterium]MUL46616.1 hypothetical protein [Mycolicibacterium sp. CBMA 360]MUL59083.1 hypothetical protein [Mycolicibacterium sp. CBMA 335]MUL69477.1 hypothetical protein [Mycolicibacterium sp. CBMA 311]MUL94441.1 hypothetical protein [Mycolicibacterium sp. CBMA 230]MUM06542.1 hypothetical protein [Mycolicibacterium sp. CBMA 213]